MEFYIFTNNVKQGPYHLDELSAKNVTADTMVWAVGFSNWKPAKQIPELADLLSNLPPEPPVANTIPKIWLVESILVTCFCCLPFGIMGIINATKIESLYCKGEYEQALYRSKQARKWVLWGFFIMLAFWVIYILGWGIYLLMLTNY